MVSSIVICVTFLSTISAFQNPILNSKLQSKSQLYNKLTEHLIGEEMVTDDLSASLLADRCMEEAKRLFYSKAEGWRKVDIMDPEIDVEVLAVQ